MCTGITANGFLECTDHELVRSVFRLSGSFKKIVGKEILKTPQGITTTAAGELVVADVGSKHLVIFSRMSALVCLQWLLREYARANDFKSAFWSCR